VKVIISGEGGDEAFGGYQTYRGILWLERIKSLMGPLKPSIAYLANGLSRGIKNQRFQKYAPLLDLPFEDYYYGRSYRPKGNVKTESGEFYSEEFLISVDHELSLASCRRHLRSGQAGGALNRMLYVDTKTTLPDDLLLKADKMTMANSIELRVPLLDHKVLEFAATLLPNQKVRGVTTKFLAKKALRGRVPKEILRRRKTGFPVPYELWLMTELRSWLQDILLDRVTVSRGYFNRSRVEALIADNATTGRHSKALFSLVVLELWHRTLLAGKAP
jgi:asparagine synthase (glutamine-hydrolysing)